MKIFHNVSKYFSSNHRDKHSDKANSHQRHGRVNKTHRTKIVEFDKLDNDLQIDNDFGLHIIYFLQHSHWKVNDRNHQMEKVWFYNSEPSIDIQEYNRFTDNTTDMLIFTVIPDNNHVLKLPSPITVTVECKGSYYSINSFGGKSDIIYKVGGLSIITRNFSTLLSGNFEPGWCWDVSKRTFTKKKLDSYVEPVFSKIDFYKQCGVVNPQNASTAYLGDTDGRAGAILHASLVPGYIGIREKSWSLLCELLEHEEMASSAYKHKNNKVLYDLLSMRGMILDELHQHVFLRDDAITPCISLGDHTGDRFSTIFGDKYILTLLNSMRDMEGNKDSHVNKDVVALAGSHEINFNGNYVVRLANHELSAGDTYNLAKTLDARNYNLERRVLTNHHGIIRDEGEKCYCLGVLQVPSNQVENPADPEELANIPSKKHKEYMDDRLIRLIRSNAIVSTSIYDSYLNNITTFKPKPKGIFKYGQTLGRTKQKYSRYGLGIDQH